MCLSFEITVNDLKDCREITHHLLTGSEHGMLGPSKSTNQVAKLTHILRNLVDAGQVSDHLCDPCAMCFLHFILFIQTGRRNRGMWETHTWRMAGRLNHLSAVRQPTKSRSGLQTTCLRCLAGWKSCTLRQIFLKYYVNIMTEIISRTTDYSKSIVMPCNCSFTLMSLM